MATGKSIVDVQRGGERQNLLGRDRRAILNTTGASFSQLSLQPSSATGTPSDRHATRSLIREDQGHPHESRQWQRSATHTTDHAVHDRGNYQDHHPPGQQSDSGMGCGYDPGDFSSSGDGDEDGQQIHAHADNCRDSAARSPAVSVVRLAHPLTISDGRQHLDSLSPTNAQHRHTKRDLDHSEQLPHITTEGADSTPVKMVPSVPRGLRSHVGDHVLREIKFSDRPRGIDRQRLVREIDQLSIPTMESHNP